MISKTNSFCNRTIEIPISSGQNYVTTCKMMKAWAIRRYGGEDVLEQMELPVPTLRPRDILVRMKAASINPVDTKVRYQGGSTQTLPAPRILGYDGAGVVEQVGPEVKLFKVGDEVYFSGDISRNGTNAQFCAVDERIVGRKPKNLSWEQAAAEPLTLLTAWEGLAEGLAIPFSSTPTNKTILIINGGGGVGTIGIQLAKKRHGLKVIATASRPETIELCKKLGADAVIDHRKPLRDQLKELGHDTVDFILNCHEADEHWDQLKDIIAPLGKICIMTTRKPIDFSWGINKRVTVVWEFMFSRPLHNAEPEKQHEILNLAAELYESGELTPRLTEVKRWEELPQLHKHLGAGLAIGKYAFPVPQGN